MAELTKRQKWNGVYTDSLDDLAANKLMALLERNEPKDAADIYFLLTRANYSLERILQLAEKKFGARFGQELVWGEALKSASELDAIRPLLLAESEQERAIIIREIKDYFARNSKDFLRRTIR